MVDIIIIGAGPAGLNVAVEATLKGFKTIVLERGCIVNSICHFPKNLRFFSESKEMSIGNIPFISSSSHPTRCETIRYYQNVARNINTEIKLRYNVEAILGSDNAFLVKCTDKYGAEVQLRSKKIVIATGNYDNPRRLYIPGEELNKVSHYYTESYTYEGGKALIVGGGDSAAETALELIENNVEVSMSYRQQAFPRLKPWVLAKLNEAIGNNDIKLYSSSLLKEIRKDSVILNIKERGDQEIENDYVFLLTGYKPDVEFLKKSGITVNEGTSKPVYFQDTFETNVKGIYLAGVIISGIEAVESPIKNFITHGKLIIKDILSKM